jgi:hypothetical protein
MSAPGLLTRQQTWLRSLISPEQADLDEQELQQWSGGVRDVNRALAVYINNIRANVLGALRKTYPLTQAWVGQSQFSRAVISGLRVHPPRSGDLSDYGAWLPDVLAALAATDDQAQNWRALAELEWHLDQDRSAPHQTPWTLQEAAAALSADDDSTLHVTLCAPFRLLKLPHKAWQAVWAHRDVLQGSLMILNEPACAAEQVHVLQQGTRLLVMQQADWDWLAALDETTRIEEATQRTLALHPDLPLAALLQTLLTHNVLTLNNT